MPACSPPRQWLLGTAARRVSPAHGAAVDRVIALASEGVPRHDDVTDDREVALEELEQRADLEICAGCGRQGGAPHQHCRRRGQQPQPQRERECQKEPGQIKADHGAHRD